MRRTSLILRMALRLAGIRLPDQKIGQLSQENVSSSAHSASFRPNVTDHSGNMTDDSGRGRKSVTFNRNRRSRSVGTTGHVQTESAVNLVRNTHVAAFRADSNDFCRLLEAMVTRRWRTEFDAQHITNLAVQERLLRDSELEVLLRR